MPMQADESSRDAHTRARHRWLTRSGITALLFAAAPAGAQPMLTSATASIPNGFGPVPLSIAAPITIFPYATPGTPIDVELRFDRSVEAFRGVAVNGSTAIALIDPMDPTRVQILGFDYNDGSVLDVTIGRIADSMGDIAQDFSLRFGVLHADFTRDRSLDSFDLISYQRLFDAGEPGADRTGDGSLSIGDQTEVITRILGDASIPNTPPRIDGPASAFAPVGGSLQDLIFTVRDDFTATSLLSARVTSSDPALLDSSQAVTTVSGDQVRVTVPGTFPTPGSATLTLTIDDGEAQASSSVALRVGVDQPPTARLSAPQYLGVAPITIRFDGSPSSDNEGPIASYSWNIGGMTATTPVFDGTFTAPGTYPVSLEVTDSGGLSSTVSTSVTIAASPWQPSMNVSEAEARRFLWQAAWGASEVDVAFVMANGFEAWIDAQQQTPGNYYTMARMDAFEVALAAIEGVTPDLLDQELLVYQMFDDFCVTGSDQLRQRTAWALIQAIPIRPDFDAGSLAEIADLYNLYIRAAMPEPAVGASGNYFDLLSGVTYTGAMGDWLTYKGNRRADAALGTSPDENYAREIMQLFTIGLFERNPDGTPVIDAFGDRIPTYDNEDVKQFARVFTGLIDANPNAFADPLEPVLTAGPMAIRPSNHEPGAKQLLDYPGATPQNGLIPATTNVTAAAVRENIRQAILNVFNHPSHPPFLAELMIKRFTTSNPTPAYVRRVADAYTGIGPYGRGFRGDVAVMVKAILLDDEARNPAYRSNPMYGRVLEPMQVYLGVARSFGMAHQGSAWGARSRLRPAFGIRNTTGQGYLLTPSVFNFYLPTYAPPTSDIAAVGKTAPELQILDEFTSIAGLVEMTEQLEAELLGTRPPVLAQLQAEQGNPSALAARVAGRLDHGWADAATRQQLATAVGGVEFESARVFAVLMLAMGHPEFRVLR